MVNNEDRIEALIDPSKRNMDRNRGLQANTFMDVLMKAAVDTKKTTDDTVKPENSGQ